MDKVGFQLVLGLVDSCSKSAHDVVFTMYTQQHGSTNSKHLANSYMNIDVAPDDMQSMIVFMDVESRCVHASLKSSFYCFVSNECADEFAPL